MSQVLNDRENRSFGTATPFLIASTYSASAGYREAVELSSVSEAGDFDWITDLNIQAQAGPSGFRAALGARFRIGDAEISAVLGNIRYPAEAYMVFQLGEMSRHPTDFVIQQYRAGKGNDWAALAKSLGIKPGSTGFHALKKGHHLYDDRYGEGDQKGKDRGKDKGKKQK